MKAQTKVLGDYDKSIYSVGNHEFFTVPSSQVVTFDNCDNQEMMFNFEAEAVYINGVRIENDMFQKMINIYSGRQQKSKRLTRRVNQIKAVEPLKNIYDACSQAHRELKI